MKKHIIFLVIIAIIVVSALLVPKKKENNQNETLIINNEDVTSKLSDKIIVQDDVIYMSLDDTKNCLDSDLYQEDENIILSGNKKIAVLQLNNNTIEINGSKVEINGQAFEAAENKIYIPISELENVYDIEFSYMPDYKNIVIDYYENKLEKADAVKNISVKKESKVFSNTVEKVKKGDWVVYISNNENGWSYIRTQNGNLGYVKTKKLDNFVTEREDFESEKNADVDESKVLKKDITNENIEKYSNRKKLIEKIIFEAIEKEKNIVKITYKKEKDEESFRKFQIEAVAILKECGITIMLK